MVPTGRNVVVVNREGEVVHLSLDQRLVVPFRGRL
jgi:hypothetical protein